MSDINPPLQIAQTNDQEITHKASDSNSNLAENALSWLKENIAKPVANVGLDSLSVIKNSIKLASGNNVDLGKSEHFHLERTNLFTSEWLAQNISSGLAMAIPYAIAGKLAGSSLNILGERLYTSGALAKALPWNNGPEYFSKALQWRGTGTILGATTFDSLKDLKPGESTLGNAGGAMAGFTIFEIGNTFAENSTKTGKILWRLGSGALGAVVQASTTHSITNGELKLGDDLYDHAVTGGSMNLILPAIQGMIGKGFRYVNIQSGRGELAKNYAKEELTDKNSTSSNRSETLENKLLNSPWVRVRQANSGEPTSYLPEQQKVVINRSENRQRDTAILGEELEHHIQHRTQIHQYREAASLLNLGETAKAQSLFLATRLNSEWQAKLTGQKIADELSYTQQNGEISLGVPTPNNSSTRITTERVSRDEIPSSTASNGKTYAENWSYDWQIFRDSQGRILPKQDFTHKGTDSNTSTGTKADSQPALSTFAKEWQGLSPADRTKALEHLKQAPESRQIEALELLVKDNPKRDSKSLDETFGLIASEHRLKAWLNIADKQLVDPKVLLDWTYKLTPAQRVDAIIYAMHKFPQEITKDNLEYKISEIAESKRLKLLDSILDLPNGELRSALLNKFRTYIRSTDDPASIIDRTKGYFALFTAKAKPEEYHHLRKWLGDLRETVEIYDYMEALVAKDRRGTIAALDPQILAKTFLESKDWGLAEKLATNNPDTVIFLARVTSDQYVNGYHFDSNDTTRLAKVLDAWYNKNSAKETVKESLVPEANDFEGNFYEGYLYAESTVANKAIAALAAESTASKRKEIYDAIKAEIIPDPNSLAHLAERLSPKSTNRISIARTAELLGNLNWANKDEIHTHILEPLAHAWSSPQTSYAQRLSIIRDPLFRSTNFFDMNTKDFPVPDFPVHTSSEIIAKQKLTAWLETSMNSGYLDPRYNRTSSDKDILTGIQKIVLEGSNEQNPTYEGFMPERFDLVTAAAKVAQAHKKNTELFQKEFVEPVQKVLDDSSSNYTWRANLARAVSEWQRSNISEGELPFKIPDLKMPLKENLSRPVTKELITKIETDLLKNPENIFAPDSFLRIEFPEIFGDRSQGGMIGRVHDGHDFTADIHTATAMKYAISHPDFAKLTKDQQINLLYAIAFHDGKKLEQKTDYDHEWASASVAWGVLRTLGYSDNRIQRIVNLIANHRELGYDEGNTPSKRLENEGHLQNLAIQHRHEPVATQLKIMNTADMEAVLKDKGFSAPEKVADLEKASEMLKGATDKFSEISSPIIMTEIPRGFNLVHFNEKTPFAIGFHDSSNAHQFIGSLGTIESPNAVLSISLHTNEHKAIIHRNQENPGVGFIINVPYENIARAHWNSFGSGDKRNREHYIRAVNDWLISDQAKELGPKLEQIAQEAGFKSADPSHKFGALKAMREAFADFDSIEHMDRQLITQNGPNITNHPWVIARQKIHRLYTRDAEGNPLNPSRDYNELEITHPMIAGLGIIRNNKRIFIDGLSNGTKETQEKFLNGKAAPDWLIIGELPKDIAPASSESTRQGVIIIDKLLWQEMQKRHLPITVID